MSEQLWNTTILILEHRSDHLDNFRSVLEDPKAPPQIVSGQPGDTRVKKGERSEDDSVASEPPPYRLLLASGGREALELMRREEKEGGRIAGAFLNLRLEDEDGIDILRQLLEIDHKIICALITEGDVYPPEFLSTVFPRQDNFLYFNVPFSPVELIQTARFLIAAWNRRRRQEAQIDSLRVMVDGLFNIQDACRDINRAPLPLPSTILRGVLRYFVGLAQAEDGFIILQPQGGEPMEFGTGRFAGRRSFKDFSTEYDLARRAIDKREMVFLRNMTATPLLLGNETLGSILVERRGGITTDPVLLQMFAAQAGGIIQNSRLFQNLDERHQELGERNHELLAMLESSSRLEGKPEDLERLSYMDPVTGVSGRRFLEKRFHEELVRARRRETAIACMLIVIDQFGELREAGDESIINFVLRETGAILRATKRTYDVVGYNDDGEFVWLLEQFNEVGPLPAAERLRGAVEKQIFTHKGESIDITVSIGCTSLIPTAEDTIESILQAARRALQAAEDQGRNQCVEIL